MRTRLFLLGVLVVGLFGSFPPSEGGAEEMTPAFGPRQYARRAGPPQRFTDTFSHCGTAACQIVVTNGNPDGTGRISSAVILLNGVPVAGPSDFNQRVGSLVIPVGLSDTNELTVVLASRPGGSLTVRVECAASPANLVLGPPGVNLLDPVTLLSAVPIANTGTAPAGDVMLNDVTLPGGTLTIPPSLPFDVGAIPAGGSVVLNADFTGAFVPLASYPLELKGTYTVGAATYCFDLSRTLVIPPAAPGSAPLRSVSIPSNVVSGAPFPPQPPEFGDEVNQQQWTVPTAPFELGGPPPGSTSVLPTPISSALRAPLGLAPLVEPPPIVFAANNGLGTTSVSGTAEPSGASGGGVIFVSANSIAAYSTDGGDAFTSLDPTTIFPNDAIGFCCDQIVQYLPSIDRFVWLLQGGGLAGYRLAVASPAQIIASGGTAWTYWNLPATLFGTCSGFDYPDLSVGNNFLYMSWDAGFGGCNGGFQVARTSFAGLQAAGTITIEFTDPANGPMAWGSHLMQDTGDEIFWAGHNNNKSMRIFSLQESSNTYFWRDVGISSWANNSPLTSNTADSQNWINFLFNPTSQNPGGGFPANAVLGSTRVGNQLWFAWSAGTNSSFAQPHIEMVTLDRSDDFSKIQQVQIWNPDYAFAYPALATNVCTGEVGLSFEFGGGGNYENHVVGFWGDFVAYITTGSDVGSTRFGDYVSIRQAPPTPENPGNLFTAFGYGLNRVPPPEAGTLSDVHYVLFGRPSSSCVIIP
jgi:hypothetical protein